ncbi:hypothetical protein P879_11425 [Paragonimus westermani]|uniref:Ubiquitin-like domain-containing protein n=1 Tax=Paragonimus westermani TaxID=34504 RepID=A0A8T0D8I6_9TREM|nr:hypothetical protein P879_11425 [Paragonimus westermani]
MSLWSIRIKTPTEEKTVSVPEDGSIKQLREEVSKAFNAPVKQICLIFAGRILNDNESLAQHKIKDGLIVHLVIRVPKPEVSVVSVIFTARSPQTRILLVV